MSAPAENGLDLCVQEAADLVEREYGPGQRWCLVKHWTMLTVAGVGQPLLYAETVIHDSAGRFAQGEWVRTSPAVEPPANGLFRTRNTLYILNGPGAAASTTPQVVLSLH